MISSLLLFSFLSLSVWAQPQSGSSPLTTPSENCRCNSKIKDIYEEPLAFNFGPHKGSCVDSCRFRPARLLGTLAKSQKNLELTNILHRGEYWTATVPVDSVIDVSMAFEEFAPRVNHVFLQFHFNPKTPILLKSQRVLANGKLSKETTTIQDLVVSSEGVPPKSGSYSLWEGYQGYYILAHRLQSLDETVAWMVGNKKHPVTQYSVQLNEQERKAALIEALVKTDRESFQTIYYLFTNNCATSAMSTLQAAKPLLQPSWLNPSAWYPKEWSWDLALPVNLPLGTRRVLQSRGWVDLQKSVLWDQRSPAAVTTIQ